MMSLMSSEIMVVHPSPKDLLIQAARKGVKGGLLRVGTIASLKGDDPETGSHPYRVLHGPNRGLIFYTRNPEQSYAVGYEPKVSQAIHQRLKDGDVFYDIGANEGWFTLLAGRKIGSFGEIYAFEPDDVNISVLERNVKSSRTENVQIVALGVGDVTTTLKFASYENCGLVNHIVTPSALAAPDAIIT